VSAIASSLLTALKSVNSFATLHHLFDISAKSINIDEKFFCSLLPCFGSNFAQNVIIFRGNDYFLPVNFIEIHAVFLQSERNIFGTGHRDGQKTGDTRPKNGSNTSQAAES